MKVTATKVVTVEVEMNGWEADYLVKMLDRHVDDKELQEVSVNIKHKFIQAVTKAAREMK